MHKDHVPEQACVTTAYQTKQVPLFIRRNWNRMSDDEDSTDFMDQQAEESSDEDGDSSSDGSEEEEDEGKAEFKCSN